MALNLLGSSAASISATSSAPGIPLPEIGEASSHPETFQGDAIPTKSEALVAWLKQKALADPGYSLFIGSHHRVVQNPDIVAIWKFTSDFHKVYYNAKNPILVSDRKYSINTIH
jgi:hypothetical protein